MMRGFHHLTAHRVKFLVDNWLLILAALVSGGLLLAPVLRGGRGGGIGTAEAVRLINREKGVLVDVCEPNEYAAGHAIGARNQAATRVAGHVAFAGGALVMSVGAIAFAFFPQAVARLVTNQQSIIAASVPLMLVAAVFQLSDGIQAAGAGVLRGAGDTHYAFVANLVGHWGIGLPVSLYLGFRAGMGVVGLWWGLCVGLTVVAILLFVRFERLSGSLIEPI